MAVKRQKRKHVLTVHRPIVTVDRNNVSFPIERFQAVNGFLFLILKTPLLSTPPPRHQVSAVGGGVAATVVRTRRPVDNFNPKDRFSTIYRFYGEERTHTCKMR